MVHILVPSLKTQDPGALRSWQEQMDVPAQAKWISDAFDAVGEHSAFPFLFILFGKWLAPLTEDSNCFSVEIRTAWGLPLWRGRALSVCFACFVPLSPLLQSYISVSLLLQASRVSSYLCFLLSEIAETCLPVPCPQPICPSVLIVPSRLLLSLCLQPDPHHPYSTCSSQMRGYHFHPSPLASSSGFMLTCKHTNRW